MVGVVLIVKTWGWDIVSLMAWNPLWNWCETDEMMFHLADMSSLSMLSITWYVPDVALQEILVGRDATDIYRLITDQIKNHWP